MKTMIIWLLVSLFLAGVGSCERPAPTVGLDAASESLTDTVANDETGEPVDAQELGVPPGSADANDSISSDASTQLGTCDVGPSLPLPGEPCAVASSVRCTNVGAKTVGAWEHPACFRPNAVVCEKDPATGVMRWVLHPGDEIQPPGACPTGLGAWTCVSDDNSAVFGSQVCGGEGVCDPSDLGKSFCAHVDNPRYWLTCRYPTMDDIQKAGANTACWSACQSVPQLFESWCNGEISCSATGQGPATASYPSKCLDDGSSTPHCAVKCEEIGQKSTGP